jgi:hypothetical protein
MPRSGIDPNAVIRFVPGKGYVPNEGEIRFDMFEGELTHEGDRCSFEVLLSRVGPSDPALQAIGKIVHDIDLKDGKFGREEATGIAHLIAGIAMAIRKTSSGSTRAVRSSTTSTNISTQSAGDRAGAADGQLPSSARPEAQHRHMHQRMRRR